VTRTDMRGLNLDGTNWKTRDDSYDSFFHAVGSPIWHGRNFNALRDSIAGGQVNRVELPYTIHILGFEKMPPVVREIVKDFCDLVDELHSEGHTINVVRHGQ